VASGTTSTPRSPLSKAKYGGQLVWWFLRNPIENSLALRERRAGRRSGWQAGTAYPAEADWERQLHTVWGAAWPCAEHKTFDEIWSSAVAELERQGLVVGREAFGGWDDGDRALARAAWCIVRHTAPERIVETGVGRGLTTRTILEALKLEGRGHLWSVDRPPPLSPSLKRQTGAAVPEELRSYWTYVHGSSRRRLPKIVADIERVDLFVHDSMHTTRNVEFELDCVWPALRSGGVALVDDIDMNLAFSRFTERHREVRHVIALSDDGQRRFGLIAKTEAHGAAGDSLGSPTENPA